jgi:hypothetical protein
MQAPTVVTALVLGASLVACARGRSEEPVIDGATADAGDQPMVDAAPMMRDSPTSNGTCAMAFTGTLATWSFTGETGTQAMTAAATKANGVTAGAVTRAATLTAVSGAGSINSSNWPLTATRDATKFYAFTLTPPAGCELAITAAAIDARASGTGPASAQLATSADSYTAAATVSTSAAGNVAFTATANGMIELRVFGFAATATGGTFRLQNTLSITGELK